LLSEQLEAANYPVREIESIDRDAAKIELVATLVGTTADPRELDAVVSTLSANPIVDDTTWATRTE
jgi:putative Mg2+ transporter-C (MgtC) family protein